MLENLRIPNYSMMSDNVLGAENQQESLVNLTESSETKRQLSFQYKDKDIVPSAWRHAGIISKEELSAQIN